MSENTGQREKSARSVLMAGVNELVKENLNSRSARSTNIDDIATRDAFHRTARKAPPTAQIVGGQERKPNTIPFIISLQYYGGVHFCGGSLIRSGSSVMSDIVLTTARCYYDATLYITVSAGAHDLTLPTASQQTVKVTRGVRHPLFVLGEMTHDIAILKLEKPIKFTSTVQPVNLPRMGDTPSPGTNMTIAGWGDTKEFSDDLPSVLRYAEVSVVAVQECVSKYASYGVQFREPIMICAGVPRGGVDACVGDTGGPLFTEKSYQSIIYGLVSFETNCARADVPGVYTRVDQHVAWIQNQIKSLTSAP